MRVMEDLTRKVMKVKIGLLLLQKKLKINLMPTKPSSLSAERSSITTEYGHFFEWSD